MLEKAGDAGKRENPGVGAQHRDQRKWSWGNVSDIHVILNNAALREPLSRVPPRLEFRRQKFLVVLCANLSSYRPFLT